VNFLEGLTDLKADLGTVCIPRHDWTACSPPRGQERTLKLLRRINPTSFQFAAHLSRSRTFQLMSLLRSRDGKFSEPALALVCEIL